MGSQSAINKSIRTFKQELKKTTESNSKKLIYNKVYALGEGYCEDTQDDVSYLLDIISIDDDTLNCLLEKLLKGI